MACFTLAWVEQLLIWLVFLCVLIGIAKVVLPMLLGLFGSPPGGGVIMTVINYVLWGIAAIFVIIIVFDLISCVVGSPSIRSSFPVR